MENGDVNTVFLAWSLIFGLFAAAHTDIINVVILGFLFILLGISFVNERSKNERSLFICVFIQFCIVISVFVLRYMWRIGYCYKYECCDTQWISANISGWFLFCSLFSLDQPVCEFSLKISQYFLFTIKKKEDIIPATLILTSFFLSVWYLTSLDLFSMGNFILFLKIALTLFAF